MTDLKIDNIWAFIGVIVAAEIVLVVILLQFYNWIQRGEQAGK